jgi:carbohydrate diacid regulator
MKDAIDRPFGVIDENGIIAACSDPQRIGEPSGPIKDEILYTEGQVVFGGYTYHQITVAGRSDCVAFVQGDDVFAARMAAVLAISFANIRNLYDEKHDRSSFIKNIILDNILPSDIFVKSKELRFTGEEQRIVFLIKFFGSTDVLPYEMVQGLFPDRSRDYVINVGEQDIVLVKEVNEDCEIAEMEALAASIAETLNTEFYARVAIGISTVVDSLKDLARAYKEARVAIEVGKVFDTEKTIVSYENLGIGRLVYQLPSTLCDIFLQEVFKKGSIESLDRETLMTVQAFFENNLNVSETSRKLFVHRNTLVYRLEKIRKLTGLDLREFDHAITFKVALMVKKYLTSKPVKF